MTTYANTDKKKPFKFEDERDERAWVAFVAACIAHDGVSYTSEKYLLSKADSLIEHLRARRSNPSEALGPYRGAAVVPSVLSDDDDTSDDGWGDHK